MFNPADRVLDLALLISVLTLAAAPARAADAAAEEDLVVTASRTGRPDDSVPRAVSVLGPAEIAAAPVQSVSELIAFAAGVDLQERGPQGVQADLGLRGSTFEETLVLLDGVKMSDSQTGHHVLDLPVTLADIEHIEVLRGPAARLYGPNAFAGVVNIITRRPDATGATLAVDGGDHTLWRATASGTVASDSAGVRASASSGGSRGYRYNTGSDTLAANARARASVGGGELTLTGGVVDKRFGANGFYGAQFHEAFEHTTTAFAAAAGAFRVTGIELSPRVSARRHDDDFELDRSDPLKYHNVHTTFAYAAELEARAESPVGRTAVVGELALERIFSTRLGDHERSHVGLLLEHRLPALGPVELVGGASLYRYSSFGVAAWPGADVAVTLTSHLTAYASVGKAFRVPTFTELYYSSPTDRGNASLRPEEAWTYEGGLRFHPPGVVAQAGVFRRDSQELIDWVHDAAEPCDKVWCARNIGSVVMDGVEAELTVSPRRWLPGSIIERARLSYAWLGATSSDAGLESKYALAYLRHRAFGELTHRWWGPVSQTWVVRLEQRVGRERYVLVDTRVGVTLDEVELVLTGNNLGDTRYEGAGGVPMPGRWVSAGLRVALGD